MLSNRYHAITSPVVQAMLLLLTIRGEVSSRVLCGVLQQTRMSAPTFVTNSTNDSANSVILESRSISVRGGGLNLSIRVAVLRRSRCLRSVFASTRRCRYEASLRAVDRVFRIQLRKQMGRRFYSQIAGLLKALGNFPGAANALPAGSRTSLSTFPRLSRFPYIRFDNVQAD